MITSRSWRVLTVWCAFAASPALAAPAGAQTTEVKEKPPLYSYLADWEIPRAQWGAMATASEANRPILDKAIADGTIVAYGNDEALIHQSDGATHDSWWSAMSISGLLKVLEQFYASGSATSPALSSATKHWDTIYVSRYYNWHSGSWKNAYTSASSYQLKPDAPDNALDLLSKSLVVPILEKLLADGTIHEYEIDTLQYHNGTPRQFWIVYIAANADGPDKLAAALQESGKTNPMGGPAFWSMVDPASHRDSLDRTSATYK